MSKCKACGNTCRKTVIAHVVKAGQAPVAGRVCLKCSGGAICLVVASQTTEPCACGEVATKCAGCVEKAKQRAALTAVDLKKHVRHLEGLVKAYERDSSPTVGARIEGLDMAINYLKSAAALLKE